MTQKEILQYEKRCSKFLGAEIQDVLERIYIDKMKDDELLFHNHSVNLDCYEWDGTNHYIPFNMLQFHSDWNWIMEVVKSINQTQNPKQGGDTTHSTLKREIQALLGKADKEAVVEAINKFLIWYEQNNMKPTKHIEKLHLEAIKDVEQIILARLKIQQLVDKMVSSEAAVSQSAEITENIAIEFVEWVTLKQFSQCTDKLWRSRKFLETSPAYTTKELFQEYLKSKEK